MKFVFIADFFADEVLGGGELNNEELINILISSGYDVEKIKSQDVSASMITDDKVYIVANFIGLNEMCKQRLHKAQYVIYEHDHKYLITRNPAYYKEFKAPKDHITNYEFYKNANSIICQSKFHAEIVKKNLELDNIKSVGGNLWNETTLSTIQEISNQDKSNRYSIMNSNIDHKNTKGAVDYCEKNNYNYELINACAYEEFLVRLGSNAGFVFFPKTPETLSRIVVEARMMGLKVITNKLVGATKEEWFKYKGSELIDIMRRKRQQITNIVLSSYE